jgi:hypothetical protein
MANEDWDFHQYEHTHPKDEGDGWEQMNLGSAPRKPNEQAGDTKHDPKPATQSSLRINIALKDRVQLVATVKTNVGLGALSLTIQANQRDHAVVGCNRSKWLH